MVLDQGVAGRIVKMRRFIDERFAGGSGDASNAHDALNYLLAGDAINGDACLRRLELRAAVDMRRKLGELDLVPKNQGRPVQE